MVAVTREPSNDHDTDAVWANNMAALSLCYPTTATSLREFYDVVSTRQKSDICRNGIGDEVSCDQADDLSLDNEAAKAHQIVLLGCGAGDILIRELSQGRKLFVVEPDISVLYFFLIKHDVSQAVLDGQLQFFVANCKNTVLHAVSLQECTLILQKKYRQCSSNFAILKGGSFDRHCDFFNAIIGATGMWQSRQTDADCFEHKVSVAVPQLQGDSDIVPFVRHSRANANPGKHDVLVISPRCAIFNDLASAFKDIGLKVFLVTLPADGSHSIESEKLLLRTIQNETASLILSRNRTGFETIEPSSRTQLDQFIETPMTHWWWDTPNVASVIDLEDTVGRRPHLAFARELLTQLPVGSMWLPPGAQPRFCDVTNNASSNLFTMDISFVGQSRIKLLLRNVSHYIQSLSDLVDKKFKNLFDEFNDLRGMTAYYEFLSNLSRTTEPALDQIESQWPKQAYYLRYIFKMAVTIAFRLAAIQTLINTGFNVRIFGDEDWVTSGVISKSRYGGPVEPEQLPAIYQASRINLNLNFMQVSSAMNPKVLDVAAVGGVVLSDYRPEVEYLFPEQSIRPFTFVNLDDLPEKASQLLSLDLVCYRSALKEFACQHHTLKQRAQWICNYFGLG